MFLWQSIFRTNRYKETKIYTIEKSTGDNVPVPEGYKRFDRAELNAPETITLNCDNYPVQGYFRGLTEDVDYKVVTTANPLVFLPGINDMPIRIRWLKNPVDPTKDNTVTIRLTGNSKGYNLGFPGPDHVQSEVVIEKRNN